MEPRGTWWEVARTFLWLGLRSFGGPVAHVGHFRAECVSRLRWVDDAAYGPWVALCQFLPGPASTQLAFCLGWLRSGWAGGWIAFVAFTVPSAVLMTGVAWGLPRWVGPWSDATLHGLKIAAWAVVGHAVAGMAMRFKGAPAEWIVAILAGVASAWWPRGELQPLWVVGGAVVGGAFSRRDSLTVAFSAGTTPLDRSCWLDLLPQILHRWLVTGLEPACASLTPRLAQASASPSLPSQLDRSGLAGVSLRPWLAWGCLGVAVALLVTTPAWGAGRLGGLGAAMYRAGAMVFGGGHVVLPFLEESVVVPGWVTRDDFLAGYGAAQVMPGPMFTLGSYLGMRAGGWPGAIIGTVAIFLPGLLLVSAIAPSWSAVASKRSAARAVSGAGAAVVGLLASAWLGPVWDGAMHGGRDLVHGCAAMAALGSGRVPVWLVVGGCVVVAVGRFLVG